MAALFQAIFGCCCGTGEKDAKGDNQPLLDDYEAREELEEPNGSVVALPGEDDERTLHLNQQVADIVQNGTGRMLTPGMGRTNGLYSPVLPPASTSQANLNSAVSRTPHTQRSQPESRHSSQSSRHSSYKQHQPSLVPHLEGEQAPSEDGTSSALDALNPNTFSFASNAGGTKSRQQQDHVPNYGSIAFGTGLGATATTRRFQIHRGRPPTRQTKGTGNDQGPNDVRSSVEQLPPQINGVQAPAELAHEVKERLTSETSAEHKNSSSTSSPQRINRASQDASAERKKVHFELPPGDLILHYD